MSLPTSATLREAEDRHVHGGVPAKTQLSLAQVRCRKWPFLCCGVLCHEFFADLDQRSGQVLALLVQVWRGLANAAQGLDLSQTERGSPEEPDASGKLTGFMFLWVGRAATPHILQFVQ